MAKSVKDNLELKETTVLADKGYYDTQDFKDCHDKDITTVVAIPQNKSPREEIFSKEEFQYDKENNCYYCPSGKMLPFSVEEKSGQQKYRSFKACKNCPLKSRCTTSTHRTVYRHKDAEHAEQNDKYFKENLKLYKQRQMLCEHPFGTIKRTMGIRQFQTRGKKNVTAEVALIFLANNLKRMRVIHNKENKKTGKPFKTLLF